MNLLYRYLNFLSHLYIHIHTIHCVYIMYVYKIFLLVTHTHKIIVIKYNRFMKIKLREKKKKNILCTFFFKIISSIESRNE